MYQVHVPLAGKKGGDCLSEAVHLHDRVYRLIGPVAGDRPCRYSSGDVVECEMKTLANGKTELEVMRLLVAPSAEQGQT